MKKTIAISKDNSGRLSCLEQIMTGATMRGFVVSKYTKVFDSKKKGAKFI